MSKETVNKNDGSGNKASRTTKAKEGILTKDSVESLLPVGSWQRVAAGVAAAAGGGLLAVAAVGVGPAAIAGAAGYLAYRGLNGSGKSDPTSASNKH